jgi:hypothetical protein
MLRVESSIKIGVREADSIKEQENYNHLQAKCIMKNLLRRGTTNHKNDQKLAIIVSILQMNYSIIKQSH